MRPLLAGLMLAYGVIGMVDRTLASVYVPGHVRDGFYIRPHFVSAPKTGRWPDRHRAGEPREQAPPLLVPQPRDRDRLSEAS